MKRHVIAVGALLVLGSIGPRAQATSPCAFPSFRTVVNIDTGLVASGVVIGDFNSDGAADLALTNQDSNDVSILLGDGTGSDGGKADFQAGGPPQRIAAVDLDDDGMLDLVLPIQVGNAAAILWGDGTGGFGEPAMFAVEGGPFMPVIADVNADRRLDVAVTPRTAGSRRVAVLSRNGGRGFHTSYHGLFQSSPIALGVGDFNRDAFLDIAASNSLPMGMNSTVGGFSRPK